MNYRHRQQLKRSSNGFAFRSQATIANFFLPPTAASPERYLHFHVADHGDVMLGAIFGVGPDRTSLDIEYEQEQATIWEPLPRGYLAIADDPGETWYC